MRSQSLPNHLAALALGQWALWTDFAIRAPGFPVNGLEDFGYNENERLCVRLRDPRFRKAVLWQNPQAARSAIAKLADRWNPNPNSKTRQRRELMASYWQRYCAKNETIGFFGPLGWGHFSDEGPPITLTAGKSMIASQDVRFEVWAIEALANAIAANPLVRPNVPPHRRPDRNPDGIPLDYRAVLEQVDGVRLAATIAPQETINALESAGYIKTTFPIPLCPDPERELRILLSRVQPESIRRIGLSSLNELEDARHRVIAAETPEELDLALSTFDEVFVNLTCTSPTRQAGQHYAARTPLYLDCRRDLEITIGPSLKAALAQALEPILLGSRWFCGEIAAVCRSMTERALTMLRIQLKSDKVPLVELTSMLIPQIRKLPYELRDVNNQLINRWARILEASGASNFVEYAASIFADSQSGWPGSLWHSPDIQIAAQDLDEINEGNYLLVIGDFHQGNTLLQGLFTTLSPDPDWVIKAANCDYPPPRLVLAPNRNSPRVTGRFAPLVFGSADFLVLADSDSAVGSDVKGFLAADLDVVCSSGDSTVTTKSGTVIGTLDELLATHYSWAAQITYDPFPAAEHSARIQIGKSVLRRETWDIGVDRCTWAFESHSVDRSIAITKWAAHYAMPRRLFVLAPGEVKPLYLDLESTILIDIVAKALRKCKRGPGMVQDNARFTEMLPTPEQCWLIDAEGKRYTSEIRMVAVDLSHP